jgi:hypothetical protein
VAAGGTKLEWVTVDNKPGFAEGFSWDEAALDALHAEWVRCAPP